MSKLKELMEFPAIYTFKIVGDNDPSFHFGVEEIFNNYNEKTITPKDSTAGKFVSYSVTVELKNYEELEGLYIKISTLKGLKFHV